MGLEDAVSVLTGGTDVGAGAESADVSIDTGVVVAWSVTMFVLVLAVEVWSVVVEGEVVACSVIAGDVVVA